MGLRKWRTRSIGGRAGFSQLELLVTAATTSILFSGLYSFYRSQVFTVRTEQAVVNLKEEVDVGVDFLVKELRVAGARPASWPEVTGCGTFTKPDECASFERITEAGPDRITVQYDYRGAAETDPPDGCPSEANERIRYFLSGDQLRRQTNGDTGTVVNEVPTGGFRLTYFDGDGNLMDADPDTGLLNDADRRRVAAIRILVSAADDHPSPDVSLPLSFSRTTRVFLRNDRHC